jgi:hypothetical protein
MKNNYPISCPVNSKKTQNYILCIRNILNTSNQI